MIIHVVVVVVVVVDDDDDDDDDDVKYLFMCFHLPWHIMQRNCYIEWFTKVTY